MLERAPLRAHLGERRLAFGARSRGRTRLIHGIPRELRDQVAAGKNSLPSQRAQCATSLPIRNVNLSPLAAAPVAG